MAKKLELSWLEKETKEQKSKDWYIALWIYAISLSAVAYLLSGFTSALVAIAAGVALSAVAKSNEARGNKKVKYTINTKGIKINDILFPYSSIRRFNILEENGRPVLAVDLISVLVPDLVIPLNNVEEEDVLFFLSQFVKVDKEMQIPYTHILARSLGL